MMLSRENADLFFKLYNQLLCYANGKLGVIPEDVFSSPADVPGMDLNKLGKLRDAMFADKEIVLSYAEANPYSLDENELAIVRLWQHFVAGSFYLFRYLKKYAVFLNDDDGEEEPAMAYGVMGLSSTFDEMLGPYVPVLLRTVLLPFRDVIVCDGLIAPYPISFGGGIKASLNQAYNRAKARFGIIEQLPFSGGKSDGKGKAEMLKYYLKSSHNRDYYYEEIEDLIDEDPGLLKLYHQEMGKVHTRGYRKSLAEISFSVLPVWFALLKGTIIASGKSKEDARLHAQFIVDKKEHALVYYFQVKK